jgi:hypothetical protein
MVAATAASASQASDPPRIVPWHLIGDAGLGMSPLRIEYVYGNPVGWPATSPRAGDACCYYRGTGGKIDVFYVDGKAVGVGTNSAYYRTSDGIGVGVRVPIGPCHRTKKSACEHRWRGFTLKRVTVDLVGHTGLAWVKNARYGTRRVYVELQVQRAVIRNVWMNFIL